MALEAGTVNDPPKGRKTGSTSRDVEERLDRLERRQQEIVNVLAGVSQAGGWLQHQIKEGEL